MDAANVLQGLQSQGYPCRVSTDAGAFLCEETLYAIESLRLEVPELVTTIFVHMPPHGSQLELAGVECTCDDRLLAEFAPRLLALVATEHGEQLGERARDSQSVR